jgi:cell migration-inducing and hyaluronan-binding protein
MTSRIHKPGRLAFLFASLLLLVMICSGRAWATVATCNGGTVPSGDPTTDLQVTGPCEVPAGTYTFHNVNIYSTTPGVAPEGSLNFDDAVIDFYAENIVIENGGSLIAGSKNTPIGTAGGKVTIHLWGPSTDPGVSCVTANCGVPSTIWGSNPRTTPPMLRPTADCAFSDLPGNVNDCFYSYEALDPADRTSNPTAYFGHKVLALAYGGALQLFGKKGAIYPSQTSTCSDTDPSCTGTSWVRLQASLKPNASSMVVAGAVDWQQGDQIVITSTDYLPGHAEQLTISGTPTVSGSTTTIPFTNSNQAITGLQWPHNGAVLDLSNTTYPGISRLGLNVSSADTRAAVGLLSRSIRIVSEGDTAPVAPNYATTFPKAPTDGSAGYFFGGHTIVRQGFVIYQVQGVEFYQLGQGGEIMHYPVHFHMARQTPNAVGATQPITYVKDSSVWDSMTRWMVIHATQGIRLARNVGYESIGHGFYMEDGTETGNQLYANLGVFARGAVANSQNPRQVPGILTASDPGCTKHDDSCVIGYDNFPYYSDSNHPSVFWIMNGMNDFEYNMAAGAGTCGTCYWLVPGAVSGLSQTEKWYGYAGEQLGSQVETIPPYTDRAGTTPLETFVGNSCSSAMEAFMEVGNSAVCNGVNLMYPSNLISKVSTLQMLPSTQATQNYPVPVPANDTYWPRVGGGGRLATRCAAADSGSITNPDCTSVPICSDGTKGNCDVVVLDQFVTNFNWAQNNFSAIWVRPFWTLVIDSEIGDVQGGGLNFVTSGDYSKSSVISGFWALARKTAFVGGSQWQNPSSALSDNPYASNAGPFNPFVSKDGLSTGLKCAPFINGNANNSYCLSQPDGISMQLTNFGTFQRLFSVYDGPTYQDSNAYINIQPTYLTTNGTVTGGVIDKNAKCQPNKDDGNPCQSAGFMNGGVGGIRAYRAANGVAADNRCYLPNAAIGWKQPNGFYYAPAFHSTNLFFSSVGIRHFVTEPLFEGGLLSFDTDLDATKKEWCSWNSRYFAGFTDVDRETVLNDDDGSLTGLAGPVPSATPTPSVPAETISVNQEKFFNAPVETTECATDVAANKTADAMCPPATAKTSPYEYVTAALYPECALSVKLPPPNQPQPPLATCEDASWGSTCSNPPGTGVGSGSCVGVPLYRQLLTSTEAAGQEQAKRMMGQNTFQRSGLTVNHGVYYIDTTVSKTKQTNAGAESVNVFTPGGVYDLFFVYSQPDTQQTYEFYVGKKIPPSNGKTFGQTNVKFGYVDISTAKYKFSAANGGALPTGWTSDYNSDKGILTVTINMAGLAKDYNLATVVAGSKPPTTLGAQQCEPPTMCQWSGSVCQCNPNSPYYSLCSQKNPTGETVCDWSVKDLDCGANGCPAFQVTFPSSTYFTADDTSHRPTPVKFGSKEDPSKFNWNVNYNLVGAAVSGTQCNYTSQPQNLLCQKMSK